MIILQRDAVKAVISLLIILQLPLLEGKRSTEECPIGFQLAEDICYALKKSPERFSEKFVNCTGNLFTVKKYNSLGLPKPDGFSLWTDYRSQYPGGLYVNTSGDVLESTYEVKLGHDVSANEALCVVFDSVNNFTAVRCDEHHYRYCFIETYSDSEESCDDDLKNGNRFFGPVSTCLATLMRTRATWNQSQALCKKRGGSLIGRGWRYYNYFDGVGRKPLDIVTSSDHTVVRYYNDDNQTMIPPSDWNFDDSFDINTSAVLGAISTTNRKWELVENNYSFTNPICEKPIELWHVNLTVLMESSDGKIRLRVDYVKPHPNYSELRDSLKTGSIKCFTDWHGWGTSTVAVSKDTVPDEFILKPLDNGYYWCTHTDSKHFYVSESNKYLYIRVKEEVENIYAVKFNTSDKYTLDRISYLVDHVWIKLLEEYVFYYNRMVNSTSDKELGSYNNFAVLKYRNKNPADFKDTIVIQNKRLKRVYLDAKTVLLHVTLHPNMVPAKPGRFESIFIEYMKPVYYCDKKNKFALGMSKEAPECKLYKCVGDYNNGVDTVIGAQDGCYLPTTVRLSTTVNVSDVTPLMPTALPRPDDPIPATTHDPRDRGHDVSSSEEESATDSVVTDTPYGVSTASNEVLTSAANKPTWRPPTTPEPVTIEPSTTEAPATTRPPPQQQLDLVIEDLEDLLNTNEVIMAEDVDNAFTRVDSILVYEELDIPGRLLHLLDTIGARVDLNGSSDRTTVRDNIALVVADAQPDYPVKGISVAARMTGPDIFTNETFEIIRDDIGSAQLLASENEVVVSLPESVSAARRRVSFVVFLNDRAFQGGHEYSVNSRVLSVNVNNVTEFPPGEVIDIHLMPTSEPERNQSRACGYWQFNEDGVTGKWSQEGCTFFRAARPGLLDTCRCDHLTHFAEILVPRTVFSKANETALEILSVVGCCLSILGLLLVGLTAALFRSWRRDYNNKVWLQLCVSILILSVCFLIIVFAKFHEGSIICLLTGVALHYSVLASFCWMLVAAVLSYRKLVLVFSRDSSHKLLRASAFAWGAPCAVVGILLSVAPHSYAGRYEDKSPSGAFCYPKGLALWLAVYAPIALMLLSNWTLFILIVRSVFGKRRPQNHGHGSANEAFRCASVSCLLVFLFGLPWLFGLFSFNVVACYFFTILVTFQGFVLFFFFVIGNKKTRDLWLNKLKIKQTRKIPVTSSTYTNRSTGANVPVRGNQAPAAMEAKVSKPRSLSSSDNSRFS